MTQALGDIVIPFACGVRITVRAKPCLSRERDIRIVDIGDGKRAIEISIKAEAREGQANKALIERLAKILGQPKKSVAIKSGAASRLKIVEILGDANILSAQLHKFLSL